MEPDWGPAWLFSPADQPTRVRKAATLADVVIVDLEDGVDPSRRVAARDNLKALAGQLDPGSTVIRVNPSGTPDHELDLKALAGLPYRFYMLPKADSREAVERLGPHRVIALCETAAGVLNSAQVATADNCVALMWGSEDLATDLGSPASRTAAGALTPALLHARIVVLYAARAAGLTAVDTVSTQVHDGSLVAVESADAVAAGFDAKACIHPRQLDIVRGAFRPASAELESARRVLVEAARHSGPFLLDGRMIDEPVVRRARAVVARER